MIMKPESLNFSVPSYMDAFTYAVDTRSRASSSRQKIVWHALEESERIALYLSHDKR